MTEQIINILLKIRERITDDSDLVWTSYETADELKNEIDKYVLELRDGNEKLIKNLNIHFLPTSTFQEHSIQNGWTDEYIKLAAHFDEILNKLK